MLNGIGKIVEKVVAKELSHYCEKYSKLHFGQIRDQRERFAINVIVTLVHVVQESWEEKRLATVLFIDVKETFNYISKGQLFT